MRIGQCIWHSGFGPTLPAWRPGRGSFDSCVFGTRKEVLNWGNTLSAGLALAGAGPPSAYAELFSQSCIRDLQSTVSTGAGRIKDAGEETLAAAMRWFAERAKELQHEIARPEGMRDAATQGAPLPGDSGVCLVPDQ